jgi:hypothetical protein
MICLITFLYKKIFPTEPKGHVVFKRSIAAKNQYNFNWFDNIMCGGVYELY